MLEPAMPSNEAQRLATLRALKILDTPPEERFNRITRLAQRVFEVPIALVSLIDSNRQWFKSCQGLDASETPRSISFCGHAILENSALVIPDAARDPRFADNPLVTSAPHIRFYAGQPLQASDGSRLGTLCIIDRKPHQLSQDDLDTLRDLAAMVETELNIVDVTDATIALKNNEIHLQQVLSLQDAILASANYSIISTDLNGIIQTFNAAAEKMIGYKAADLIGKFTPGLFHDAQEVVRRANVLSEELDTPIEPGFEAFVAKAKRLGIPDENEWTYIHQDGARIPVLLSVTALVDDAGVATGYLGIATDISERKRIEQMKTEFISTVSHELRTPLTSIRGSLGLIAGCVAGELPQQAKKLVEIAHKNSERLILLVNDILDMEKIEAGKMEFHLHPTMLTPLLHQALEANRAYGEQFNIRYELENHLPGALVNVDTGRLMQVMANLLSNAAKFSPAGADVKVFTGLEEGYIRISVSNLGAGIQDEFRDHIFQKFAQADSSDTRKKGGTGLGLSITKKLVEKMGGKIDFVSQPDVLTTFFVEFPAFTRPAAPSSGRVNGQQKSILICEDDADVAALLRIMLEQEGWHADISCDAAQAKQMLAQGGYAAMTLDLALPGQNGISLIRELRAAQATASLPIIVVSATAREGRKSLDAGGFSVVDWIAKPIDQAHLVQAMKQALQKFSARRPEILHVEDDPDIFQIVSGCIGEHAGMDRAATLAEAKRKLAQGHYDLVILDLSLPDGDGRELLPLLNMATPPPPVMVFSASEISGEEARSVSALLVKSRTSNEQLMQTIKQLIG